MWSASRTGDAEPTVYALSGTPPPVVMMSELRIATLPSLTATPAVAGLMIVERRTSTSTPAFAPATAIRESSISASSIRSEPGWLAPKAQSIEPAPVANSRPPRNVLFPIIDGIASEPGLRLSTSTSSSMSPSICSAPPWPFGKELGITIFRLLSVMSAEVFPARLTTEELLLAEDVRTLPDPLPITVRSSLPVGDSVLLSV